MTTPWPFKTSDGSAEVLEYKTNVLRAFDAEQRIKLRNSPRTIFEYQHHLDAAQYALAKQTIFKNGLTGTFHVPVWSDASYVKGSLASGSTFVALDTTDVDWVTPNIFRGATGDALTVDTTTVTVDSSSVTADAAADPIGLVMVWESTNKYEILPFYAVSDTTISFSTTPSQSYLSYVVAPIRLCFPMGQISVERRAENDVLVSAQFVSVESPEHTSSSGVTLNDHPVWTAPYTNLGSVSESIARPSLYMDNGVGIIEIDPLFSDVDFGQTVSFFFQGKSDKRNKAGFVKSLNGKLKPFWLPSFNRDIEVLTGASTTQIVTDKVLELAQYIGRGLYIRYTNGVTSVTTIAGATDLSGGRVILSLSSTLPQTLTPTSYNLISFMSLVRSDTDSFRFTVGPDYSGTVTFNVLEVPN